MKLGLFALLLALSITACSSEKVATPDVTTAPSVEATKAPEITPEPTSEPTPKPTPEPTEEPIITTETLQSLYGKYNMKAGTCLSPRMIRDKVCLDIIKTNFNSITFENDLKPEAILDKNASRDAGDIVVKFNPTTISLLDWCKENNMAVRGHTLVWYSQTPSWIFYDNFDSHTGTLVGRKEMLARMESYIKQVFEQLETLGYLEMFYAYDVVNEAWVEDNGGSMRDCLWLQTIGEDYIWYAFYYADKYAPEYVDLYYNDYNEQFKTLTLYDFVQTLVDKNGNYLIDGIGLQAHLYTADNLDTYLNTVEKLGSLGLKINLTELDVSLGSWTTIKSATDITLKTQGQYYYNLINGLLTLVEEEKVNMDALTFWGFADPLSWRMSRSPLLYDLFYKPKYSYYGALQMKEYAGFPEE